MLFDTDLIMGRIQIVQEGEGVCVGGGGGGATHDVVIQFNSRVTYKYYILRLLNLGVGELVGIWEERRPVLFLVLGMQTFRSKVTP